jgi:radical SAM superfamily enzyme YgiQ (UPF0313 family)
VRAGYERKMKVLLIQPPHYYNGLSREPESFPLGLGYIAKVLLNSGHKVEVFDIWAHQLKNEEVMKKIKMLDYDVVGISALSTQYAYVKWLSAELKKKNEEKIIVGGPLATHSPRIVLKSTAVDVCVIGEGEITIKEVVEKSNDFDEIKGISFKKKGKIFENPPREYIKDLDTIDFPAWELFPMGIYLKPRRYYDYPHPLKAMNIISSRGCPYMCRFCSKTFEKIRLRSIDNIMEEIKLLEKKYGVNCIHLNDELFMINKKRVLEFCEKIEPLNIKFLCNGRVNIIDLNLLKRMKKAGCIAVGYGIESGSQKILYNMNKQITVEQSERALKETIRVKIYPIIFMMYGYPGETKESLQETINFFKKIPYVGRIYLAITTALPGSELYNDCLKKGLIKDEDKYLESLAAGFTTQGARFLLNFTEFTKEEFYRLKSETERRIFLEQVKRYPYHYVKFTLRKYLFALMERIQKKLTKKDELKCNK